MIQKITDKTYREITDQKLLTSSRLNLYNTLKDGDLYVSNIFKHIDFTDEIKNNNDYFNLYVSEDEWWDNISYKFYNTPLLWYIICFFNDIVNPYEEIVIGQQVKILKKSYLYEVFKIIKTTSEL